MSNLEVEMPRAPHFLSIFDIRYSHFCYDGFFSSLCAGVEGINRQHGEGMTKQAATLMLCGAGLLVVPASAGPPLANCHHRWAIPSDTGSYVGYPVGGGAWLRKHAEPPYPQEGTWGWDYRGKLLLRRVMLGWSHGRLYQGGSGAYRTDGPTTNHGEKEHPH